MKPVVSFVACCALAIAGTAGCGTAREPALGTTTNTVEITRTRLGASPSDLASRVVDGYNDREGDVTGDTAPERLVYLPSSRTIEVRDGSGARVGAVTTPYHVTSFGTVGAADGSSRLVVYTYPNASQGATYAVFDRGLRPEVQWDEFPATSRFATTVWRGSPAVFYLQGDVLVGRAPDGRQLTRLPVAGGKDFSRIHLLSSGAPGGERLVLLASGNGYTPFHLVAVYDDDQLVFHEIGSEHAFDLSSAADGFVVSTRSTRWAYRVPGGG